MSEDRIVFFKVPDPYGFFSNFSRHPIMMGDGKIYPTSEHFYQSQKTTDPQLSENIRTAQSAQIAFNLGQKVELRPDWESIKIPIMAQALWAKFTQHKDCQDMLLGTTGEIIENNPKDYFWAVGSDWSGENHLGKLLVGIRDAMHKIPAEILERYRSNKPGAKRLDIGFEVK